jgi:hypothetical protein
MIPDTIGRYEVQGLLGEGAFGEVYAAHDPALNRVVAIKVLRPMYGADPAFMDRFRAEAANLASLAHPNITLIHDLLQDGGRHGMIMELVRGHTLEHVLDDKRQLPLRETLAIVAQVAAGLGYTHRAGVVHRDVKPSNLMLTATGVVKIMDFGIARAQGAKRLTSDGSVLGTLAYAAPEQIKSGEGEPRSDQYSLACVVYEMLCGKPPFDAATEYELMQAHIAGKAEAISRLVPELSSEVDRALMRALAKKPAERFDTIEEFGRALGCDVVQLQAADIVRDLVSHADPLPAIPQRARSARSGPSAPAQAEAIAPGRKGAQSGAGASKSARRTPLVVMGLAAAVALGVTGFILVDSKTLTIGFAPPALTVATKPPDKPQTAIQELHLKPAEKLPAAPADIPAAKPIEMKPADLKPVDPKSESKPAEPKATAVEPKPVEAKPAEPRPPELKLAEPKPAEPKAAEEKRSEPKAAEAKPPVPELVEPKPPDKPTVDNAESGKTRQLLALPTEPLPKLPEKVPSKPPEAPRMPGEAPAYQGRVVAWIGGSTLIVRAPTGNGVQKLSLFGIRDLPGNSQSEADKVRDQLESYLAKNGREATCFTRYSAVAKAVRHQCFIDKKDIAAWAIENKLAVASADAPPDYRGAR